MTAELEPVNWDESGGLSVTKAQGLMSKNCHVCRNGYQITAMINRLIVNGAPDSEIFELLSAMPRTAFSRNVVPSKNSIKNHRKSHLPIKQQAIQRVLERRAAQHGIDMEEGVQNILTAQGMMEVIAQQGFAAIVDGKATPTVKETIDAIKASDQFDKEMTDTFDAVAAMAEVHRILNAVKAVVPDQYMELIYQKLSEGEEAIDAEVVDEEFDYNEQD